MTELYRQATLVYRHIRGSEIVRNRRTTIAAIRRVIDKLSNDPETAIEIKSRGDLDKLPRAILTYTSITCLNENDLRILDDLDKYLKGEVGD